MIETYYGMPRVFQKNKGGKDHAESISIAPVPGDDTDSVGAGHLAEEKPAAGYQLPASLKGKTVILHTNDVHGAIDKYAKVAALKNGVLRPGRSAVVLLDAGDFSQGSTYVSLSKGATAVELMNAVGYDAVTLGNHEFDYGFPQLKANLSYSAADFLVTCVNLVDDEGAPIFAPGATAPVTDADDNPLFNLTVMGVATPETQTKANPALMKGLTFLSGQKLYDAANAVIKVAREEGNADIVIALTHLGVDASSEPNRSIDFVKNVPGVDIVIRRPLPHRDDRQQGQRHDPVYRYGSCVCGRFRH